VKGFVPTPAQLVDLMIGKLFAGRSPRADESLLDPGCGNGAFTEGIIRWCRREEQPLPRIVGIDSDPMLVEEARRRLGDFGQVTLLNEDFLTARPERFDYVIGNPPYVSITDLSVAEREGYRRAYTTAVGRFDLYQLFFEQALNLLKPGGRLVFVTPEKYLYVQTAERLRMKLADAGVEEIHLIDEGSFSGLVTYPAITTVGRKPSVSRTQVVARNGAERMVRLGANGASWLPAVNGSVPRASGRVLTEAFVRISCGVATGADSVYVVRDDAITASLRPFAHPTLSGRSLVLDQTVTTTHQMLVPYGPDGGLLPESELGPLGEYLGRPDRRAQLLKRTCVARKPWYAFHETPPLDEMLRPKILCKDIGSRPWFVVDEEGTIVPRHSVYYLVPADQSQIHELCAYLNAEAVATFLMAHCQRAANGFVRLQSHILKQVPLPEEFVASPQLVCA
jgi:adenine-specific DNA-methyltransferase